MIGFVTWWAMYLGMIALLTGVDTPQKRAVESPSQSIADAWATKGAENDGQTKKAA